MKAVFSSYLFHGWHYSFCLAKVRALALKQSQLLATYYEKQVDISECECPWRTSMRNSGRQPVGSK